MLPPIWNYPIISPPPLDKVDFYSEFGAKMDTLVPHTARRLN